jgi:hypothetical protein
LAITPQRENKIDPTFDPNKENLLQACDPRVKRRMTGFLVALTFPIGNKVVNFPYKFYMIFIRLCVIGKFHVIFAA